MDLVELTRLNRDALDIYHEALEVLALPLPERRPRIAAHPQKERLAKEVTRLFAWQKEHDQLAEVGERELVEESSETEEQEGNT